VNNAACFEDLTAELLRCLAAEPNSPAHEWARITLIGMAKSLDEESSRRVDAGDESLVRHLHRQIATWHETRAKCHRDYADPAAVGGEIPF
jgi:hypothetical protein